MSTSADGSPKVAYLVSLYPAISHVFIEREIVALRERGIDIVTFTVNPAQRDSLISERALAEADRTIALLGHPLTRYVRSVLYVLRASPVALVYGLLMAWMSGAVRLRSKVWQHFYLIEATVLLEEMRRRNITHVHVHHANNSADIARLTTVMGRTIDGEAAGWRWTLSMHGSKEFFDVEGHDLAAKVRSADAIACISEHTRSELLRPVGGRYSDKTAIVRMGTDSYMYKPPDDDRIGRPDGHIRVLYVGRLVEGKGLRDLLVASRGYLDTGRSLELRVVGGGELESDLRTMIDNLHLQHEVRLMGPIGQDGLPEMYHWADVFCLPSYAEGVPVVLMEAMATGLPVVTTNVGGIPELVHNRLSGFLVEPGSVESIVNRFAQLADDVDARRQLGRNGRQRVIEEYQPSLNAQRLAVALRLDEAPDRGVQAK